MVWRVSNCGDLSALRFAREHYSHTNPNADKLGSPGRQIVLVAGDPLAAVWMTTEQRPEYVKHDWLDAWNNSLFRNVGGGLASDLILQAVAASRWLWGEPPPGGMVTFVDAAKVRHKRDPGRCYLRAGFVRAGATAGGLLAFVLPVDRFPPPDAPLDATLRLVWG